MSSSPCVALLAIITPNNDPYETYEDILNYLGIPKDEITETINDMKTNPFNNGFGGDFHKSGREYYHCMIPPEEQFLKYKQAFECSAITQGYDEAYQFGAPFNSIVLADLSLDGWYESDAWKDVVNRQNLLATFVEIIAGRYNCEWEIRLGTASF